MVYILDDQSSLVPDILPSPSRSNQMQGLLRAVQRGLKRDEAQVKNLFRPGHIVSQHSIQQRGLENTKVEDILMIKNGEKVGSWLWCHTNDTVHDAVKTMAHNVSSLVVLKPGNQQLIAGIITERDYLRKVAAQGREDDQYTRVGEIMTDESKLITVTSDMNVLQAMKLMTVINGKIVGMLSIQDVVKAVVEQQSGELKQLNEFIKGDYY